MRVLVTGSGGFIGQYVKRALEAHGHECVEFDMQRGLDVTNWLYVDAGSEPAEAVINLAGALGTSELFGREDAAVHVNILGALNVFDAAAKRGIPVVQIGTGHRGQLNPYAISKACAEDLALARAQWQGEKIAVVRAYHVYGAGQKMCAPHGDSPVRKIGPSFIARALTSMPIEINGSGKQLIDLVHAQDVAEVLVRALDGPYGEVTEAGTGVATSVVQAARDVVDASGLIGMPFKHVSMRPGEPQDAAVVALEPACPAEHAWPWKLEETIAWYREQLRAKGMLPA